MALIEIRDPKGNRLAAADDISGAIQQLVDMIGRYSHTVSAFHEAIRTVQEMAPDVSGTAPEHAAVFSAGWKTAIRTASDVLNCV